MFVKGVDKIKIQKHGLISGAFQLANLKRVGELKTYCHPIRKNCGANERHPLARTQNKSKNFRLSKTV